MAEGSLITNEVKELVFVKLDGNYRGWKVELLVEKIAKVEEKLLLCKVCQGLLREASLFENEGKQELRCSLCLPKNAVTQKQFIIQESINEKTVRCPFKSKGCEWCDMITQLLSHLDECPFFPLQCPLGCVAEEGGKREISRFERRFLEEHQRMNCPMRLISCESCNSPIKACEMNQHIQTCDEYLVPCPNSCVGAEGATRAKRKSIPSHLEECPLQEVGCPYAEYGCGEKMERRRMDRHEKESMHTHFRIAMLSMRNVNREQAGKIAGLENDMTEKEKEISLLKQNQVKLMSKYTNELKAVKEEQKSELKAVKEEQKSELKAVKDEQKCELKAVKDELYILSMINQCNGSLDWEVTGVTDKIKIKDITRSDSFNLGLYKVQCEIYWHFDSTGAIGVFLWIMKGKWDDKLTWPLKYKMEVILFNQVGAQNYTRSFEVTQSYLERYPQFFQKPVSKTNSEGYGLSAFISHDDLQQEKYLKNDTISLKIVVEPLST